jgi:hypothetical protein
LKLSSFNERPYCSGRRIEITIGASKESAANAGSALRAGRLPPLAQHLELTPMTLRLQILP